MVPVPFKIVPPQSIQKKIAQREVRGVHGIFSVPTTEKMLKLQQHENIEAAMRELTAILKEAFTSCFQDLQKRWQQCSDCGGAYFEGDWNHQLIS
jgi:hypothetical protein